ncbi:MAG TPA: XRE family transcriptional regulator [Bradyrhizobium sp.]|nr:XRE family transcriptional regulator [Bradyrhizobium sp.]
MLDVSKTAGVGPALRQARVAKGLTLEQLGSLCDLTRGYISLVERGIKAPSIAALMRIAAALDVKVASFFDPKPAASTRYTIHRHHETGARPTENGSFGLSALAAGRPHKKMEPFLLRPPFKSTPTSARVRHNIQRSFHSGEEMLFVVSGRVEIELDGEHVELEKGDCLYFSGETPHQVLSVGRQKAEVLIVISSSETP